MFYRVVSLLLVPVLFLQGMCFGHSHGGTCLHGHAGHDHAPHFHLRAIFPHHPNSQDHHGDRNDDQDHHEDDAFAPQTSTGCHDDDAVYVSGAVVLDRHRQDSQVGSDSFSALMPLVGSVGVLFAPTSSPLLTHLPPLLLHQYCPIYLRTQALLI